MWQAIASAEARTHGGGEHTESTCHCSLSEALKQDHSTSDLSDPRNRNHKSLAIGNHNFKVTSFSSRNRDKIAVSQSQKSHWAKKNHCDSESHPCSRNVFWGFPDPCGASETQKKHKTGGSRVQGVSFRGCFRSRSDFLSCDCCRWRFVISKSLRFGSLS